MVCAQRTALVVVLAICAECSLLDEGSEVDAGRRLGDATPSNCPNIGDLSYFYATQECSTTTSTTTVTTVTVTTSTTSLTTSTSTSSTTTLTTSSTTSTTTSVTTSTSTTTSTTVTTTTATTATATTTTTSTTSTTTTQSINSCPVCPLLPITGATTSVAAGSVFNPTAQTSSVCLDVISTASLSLTCPANNYNPGVEMTKTAGQWSKIKCIVCKVAAAADGDNRAGYYTGRVNWGPNILSGSISETGIAKYRVYLATTGSVKVGNHIDEQNVITSTSTCCDATRYHYDFTALRLTGASDGSYYFMVVPIDSAGNELKFGTMTEQITDVTGGTIDTGVASDARRGAGLAALALLAAVLAGAAAP